MLVNRLLVAAGAAALVAAVAGCGSDSSTAGSSAASGAQSSAAAGGGGNAIQMANFSFKPQTLTVATGTAVMWTNTDSATHTTTADDKTWDSGNLDSGKTFSFTFTKAGTFKFHCAIHNFMTGTVTVTG